MIKFAYLLCMMLFRIYLLFFPHLTVSKLTLTRALFRGMDLPSSDLTTRGLFSPFPPLPTPLYCLSNPSCLSVLCFHLPRHSCVCLHAVFVVVLHPLLFSRSCCHSCIDQRKLPRLIHSLTPLLTFSQDRAHFLVFSRTAMLTFFFCIFFNCIV